MERTPIHERVDALRLKKDPLLIAKLETGWAVLSERPLIEGHCVFFADPVVFSINDLDEETRMKYGRDLCRIGDALMKVTGSYRINYETQCNIAQALHSHVFPRQLNEPEAKRRERVAIAYHECDLDRQTAETFIQTLHKELTSKSSS